MEGLLRSNFANSSPLKYRARLNRPFNKKKFRIFADAASPVSFPKLENGKTTFGPDLSVEINGLRLPNPFVIGSGPPGTNYSVMKKAFDEGWGAVICKTVSLHPIIRHLVYARFFFISVILFM